MVKNIDSEMIKNSVSLLLRVHTHKETMKQKQSPPLTPPEDLYQPKPQHDKGRWMIKGKQHSKSEKGHIGV